MVIVKRILAAGAIALLCVSVRAGALPGYAVGSQAQQDIVASVPFDVVDVHATVALKTARAQGVPAIYRQFAGATNAMANQFLAAFAAARGNFSGALAASYHRGPIENFIIQSPDFGYFLTIYNVEHKNFPVTAELAAAWARGFSGVPLRDQWLGLLLQTMSGPVKPDALPADFVFHNQIRVVPVADPSETISFADARQRGFVAGADSVPVVSRSRAMFRLNFPEAEQLTAGALSQFLQPDCVPDVALTEKARNDSVRRIVVADHFDAGQIIVHRGDMIDAQAMAALDAMNQELTSVAANQQITPGRALQTQEPAQREPAAALLAQQQQKQAQLERDLARVQAQQESQAAALLQQTLNSQRLARTIALREKWFAAALAAISIPALLIFWRALRRPASISAPGKLQRIEKLPAAAQTQAQLAPALAQTIKDAVVKELSFQRAELLETQRQAALEIATLVRRLDQLQAPMQERLRTYEERIQELQRALTDQMEENRELLKLKIEMMRRQIETERERGGRRVNFN